MTHIYLSNTIYICINSNVVLRKTLLSAFNDVGNMRILGFLATKDRYLLYFFLIINGYQLIWYIHFFIKREHFYKTPSYYRGVYLIHSYVRDKYHFNLQSLFCWTDHLGRNTQCAVYPTYFFGKGFYTFPITYFYEISISITVFLQLKVYVLANIDFWQPHTYYRQSFYY